jgi:hypothetical protein
MARIGGEIEQLGRLKASCDHAWRRWRELTRPHRTQLLAPSALHRVGS